MGRPRRRYEQRDDEQHRREDDEGQRGETTSNVRFDQRAETRWRRWIRLMNHAGRQVRHRDPAERPLVEARQSDRPGSGSAGISSRRSTASSQAGSSASTINSGCSASTIKGGPRPLPGTGRPPGLTGTCPDRADDLERHAGPSHFVGEGVRDARRADHEDAPPRHAGPADEPLPDGDQTEDHGRCREEPWCRHSQPGDPLVHGRGEDQTRDSTDRDRDRRVDGVVPRGESALKCDDPDGGQQRDDEEAIRRSFAGVAHVDGEPDERDPAESAANALPITRSFGRLRTRPRAPKEERSSRRIRVLMLSSASASSRRTIPPNTPSRGTPPAFPVGEAGDCPSHAPARPLTQSAPPRRVGTSPVAASPREGAPDESERL